MSKKQRSIFKRVKRTAKLTTTALVIGGLIGTTIGLLTAPKKGKELRGDLEREGERLWKKLQMTKKDVEKIVHKVFDEVTPETLRIYTKAKSEVLARVAKNKDLINKQRYDQIVNSVVNRVSKSKRIKKNLPALKKELKNTWKEIKKIL